jgi:hypothetical protein
MPYYKTGAVAKELSIPMSRLRSLIVTGRLDAPAKDSSGDFIWRNEDIERARAALQVDRRRKADRSPTAENANAA